MSFVIEKMVESDWDQVRQIYQEGIETGDATYVTEPPKSWAEWNSTRIPACSLVAKSNHTVAGWACLTPISNRAVYSGVAEESIYVSSKFQGQGAASLLLKSLIEVSEKHGIWTIQAGIFPENKGSLQLHRKVGFREYGVREKFGKMTYGPYKDQWRDVILFERRSKVVGVDSHPTDQNTKNKSASVLQSK